MAPVTIAVRGLPADCTEFEFENSVRLLKYSHGCDYLLGPFIDKFKPTRPNEVDSRSTTITVTGSKKAKFIEKLQGYNIATNTDRKAVEVDQDFLGLTTIAEHNDYQVE